VYKDYLILAHPRSGTGYMSALFKANGFDVGHEVMGSHGTSNWQFAVKAKEYPFDIDGIKRQDVIFDRVYHVIRKPIDAINSIAYTEQRSEEFRALYVPLIGNAFERAVLSYYGWNKIIASQLPDYTIKLETAQKDLHFKNGCAITNTREHESLTDYELRFNLSPEILWYYEKLNEWYNSL